MDRATSLRLSRVAARELDRAKRTMGIPGHPRPYYLSYLIRDEETWRVQAKYGALIADTHDRKRNAFVDVRVGSSSSDQVRDGGLLDNDKEAESYGYVDLPFAESAGSMDGVRHGLWRLTDARYREAVDAWLRKQSYELTWIDPNRHLRAFETRPKSRAVRWTDFPRVDRARWAGYAGRVSRALKRYVDIRDSNVEFQAEHVVRVFVSSEGTVQVHGQVIWTLECYLWLLSERGDAFPWTVRHMVTDPAELPAEAAFLAEVRQAVARLRRLSVAPTLRSFCGPALLDPIPAGLLLHEALGHRLEGNRLLSSGEGQTFRDSRGRRVLPSFLSIRDDPRLERFDGRSLVGHYRYDDEGVEAQPAELVDRGKLRGFLTSRTGIERRHRSNGHARSDYHERPISRMGVLVVEARDGLDDRELKQALLDEIRRQKAPFGIRILDAVSGETATDAYEFQAFLGEVGLAAKVYPDGREEWIRGVNFVGTPLNAVHGILAAGRRREVDNGWCGAESGYVPVTTISPALVVSELELQAKPDMPFTQYSFPSPWERPGKPRAARGRCPKKKAARTRR